MIGSGCKSSSTSTVTTAGSPIRFALTVAGGYAVVGLLWILLSDRAVKYVVDPTQHLTWLQTAKGWGFVIVTASLLAVLVYRRARALQRSQQALAASYDNLRAVLDGSPMATFVLNEAGRVQHWNQAAERLLGWSASEVIGQRCPIISTEGSSEVATWVERACAGERFPALEIRAQDRPGQEIELGMVMAPMEDQDDTITGVIVMAEDLTARRDAEQLRHQRDQHQQDAEAMQEAVGIIGHELRTPLASLRATVEYIQSDVSDLPQEAGSLLGAAEEQVGQLTEMVNNMLEAARLNSGAARWTWSQVSWQQVCVEAVEILKPLIDPRRVTIETEIDPPDLTTLGDAHALRRLLLNLLSNAHKHTPQGTITVNLHQVVEGERQWVELRVTDTGKGMPPAVAEQLGRAFALNRGSIGAEHVQGAGLGLAICKGIVTAHGGHIRVRSARHQGSTFSVLLRADLSGPETGACNELIMADVAA